jgi:hypothetical protein
MPVIVSLRVRPGSIASLRGRTNLVFADEGAQRGYEPLILCLVCLHLPPLWRRRWLLGLHFRLMCLPQGAVGVVCCRHGDYFAMCRDAGSECVMDRRCRSVRFRARVTVNCPSTITS